MNTKILSLSVLTLVAMLVDIGAMSTVNAETFSEALKNGKTTINTRTFYFNRGFDAPSTTPNTEALTIGGIMNPTRTFTLVRNDKLRLSHRKSLIK